MKIEGEHVFKGPQQEIWNMFMDPNVLASALPGTQALNKVSENEFEGTINLKIGPVSGSFAGKLSMSDIKEPEACTLTVDGKGAPGFAKGVGHVHYTDLGDGTTLLKYDGDIQIGGTLASVGQRMIDSVSKSMIRQGFETLDKALEARLSAAKEGKESTFKAPTETEFAASVAKDMSKSIWSIPEVRMVAYVVPVAALLLLFVYLVSR
jgi:uncharacterized protein